MKRTLGFLALLAMWEAFTWLSGSPILVPVENIGAAFIRLVQTGEMAGNALASLSRVGLGFLMAAFLGVSLGLWIYQNKTIEAVIMPIVDAMRPVAALTIFPVIILTLGIGLTSKIFVIFWTAYPAILLNTIQGLREVEHDPQEAARLDGSSEWQVLRSVTFPLALPTIVTGLRIGLSGGWISLVAAEMLGAQSGLGWAVLNYSNSFQFPEMYASIVCIAMLGLGMNLALAGIQKYFNLENNHEKHPSPSYVDRSIAVNDLDSMFKP